MERRRHFKCPLCKKDIRHLIEKSGTPFHVEVYFWGYQAYEGDSCDPDESVSPTYFCPKCKGLIANSEEEMFKFAKSLKLVF